MIHEVVFVPQAAVNDCGLACLTMVLRSYGRQVTLAELREQLPLHGNGCTAAEIVTLAATYGLPFCGVRIPLDLIGSATLPAIVSWHKEHFVVLERFDGTRAVILDPARGRFGIPVSTLAVMFSGVALYPRQIGGKSSAPSGT